MATFLRPLSYKYQWLYDGISRIAALPVGGEKRFRHLALENITIDKDTKILDLCCGKGQTTRFLVQYSQGVTGLDISPLALQEAKKNVPQADYVEGLAQQIPFDKNTFDIVHTSVALHEMNREELKQIFAEIYRVLKPKGIFTFIDLHKPHNLLFVPGLSIFMWLFETSTAWQLIKIDLSQMLMDEGFKVISKKLYAGGSLQVIQVQK
ncbi:class I SAM-dependent methyltransferase [Cyanobacterium stanieri LEGE 03274]|uniref:Class I SAM-dependent methyltransferase n=1 Tax=Cyanobacterium stanieri LEGE 03274 TaxID=1828756 RepID=A0ABR9V6L3_9CHRO|nr:class I SAM-dependent methyltransferase [Cyanobacterium stanieri]MBE9222756.1 class I SAM-dependent methyltransferase [Cyanobacterium stanieri LEGE 03274]